MDLGRIEGAAGNLRQEDFSDHDYAPTLSFDMTLPFRMNDHGQVVGYMWDESSSEWRAFLWLPVGDASIGLVHGGDDLAEQGRSTSRRPSRTAWTSSTRARSSWRSVSKRCRASFDSPRMIDVIDK